MIPLLSVVAFFLLLTPVAPARASPAAPLIRAARAATDVAYRGEQLVATHLGGGVQVTLVRVEHDPQGWTRLEYRPVGTARRWVVLRRAHEVIRYDPATRRGTWSFRDPTEQLDDDFATGHLPLLQDNYTVVRGTATLLGRPVDRIELRPRSGDRPTRRIDVDQATGLALRSERVSPDGRLVQLTAFLSLELLPAGWAARIGPPPDVHLKRRPAARAVTPDEASTRLGRPSVVVATPRGFRRVADYLLDGPRPTWQTLYSDGASTLLVSREPGVSPRPPAGSRRLDRAGGTVWMHDIGLQRLVHWAYGGWRLTMVGEVTADSLLAAAERTGIAAPPRAWDRLLGWLAERGFPGFTP